MHSVWAGGMSCWAPPSDNNNASLASLRFRANTWHTLSGSSPRLPWGEATPTRFMARGPELRKVKQVA